MSDPRRYTHGDIRQTMIAGLFYGFICGVVLTFVILNGIGWLR